MCSLFDDLQHGLQEAIDYEKGKVCGKTYMIFPMKESSNTEIRAIRINADIREINNNCKNNSQSVEYTYLTE